MGKSLASPQLAGHCAADAGQTARSIESLNAVADQLHELVLRFNR